MEPHKLIVFDEPTAGLDYKRMSCLAELIAVCAQTSAVMVITHDTELIMKACTHCLLCDAHDTHMVVVSGNEQRIHSFMAGA
ncbi:MAG: AAA family ATPase [Atopobium sp.]|uniref:AAA family ATPase n=1 Tax=Atopobium sp. TaxID=1872650 RepID=UPI002A82F1C3|nr:AAA family ATPase [Atopobium sp.]MDY4523064.1 AAA family ATPase [Atopobium sp.]